MNPDERLETSRLWLRRFTAQDAPEVQRLAGDRRVSIMTEHIPYPYEDGMAEAWIASHEASWAARESVTLAVIDKTTDRLLGCVGLSLTLQHFRASLGYWIAVEAWGQGYCTEAALAVVNFGFNSLGLNRIEALHLSRNPASGAVMRKLGMVHEGRRAAYVFEGGKFHDIEQYAILVDGS